MSAIPTHEEYLQAKEVVSLYEQEQQRQYQIRTEAFKIELEAYLFEGQLKYANGLKLINGDILLKGCGEEWYDGEMDEDIKLLCEKHNVEYSFPYWMYGK